MTLFLMCNSTNVDVVLKAWLLEYWQWLVVAVLMLLLIVVVVYTLKQIHRLWMIWTEPFKKGHTYRCKIIRVTDGDTVVCQKRFFSRQQTTVRLAYIDAPESKQVYGSESTHALQRMVLNKNVQILITTVDGYGRHVGDLYRNGKNINETMITQGHAWAYPTYGKNKAHKEHLLSLQAKAKTKKIGLWKNRKVENPSDFRKRK